MGRALSFKDAERISAPTKAVEIAGVHPYKGAVEIAGVRPYKGGGLSRIMRKDFVSGVLFDSR
ncbi:MAG: hypothetical protein RR632_07785, partial [Christensenella sp.]